MPNNFLGNIAGSLFGGGGLSGGGGLEADRTVGTIRDDATPELRWRNGVLEQKWIVLSYTDAQGTHRQFEWRPVPSV